MNPRQTIWEMLSPDVVYITRNNFTITNVGTVGGAVSGSLSSSSRLNTSGAASTRARIFGLSQVDQLWNMESRGAPQGTYNFSLRKIFSGRSSIGNGVTDPNYTARWSHGKAEADGVGDLARRGFGWKFVGGTAPRYLTLEVHNGTSLTSVTSSFVVTNGLGFDWDIESDGAGNVTLYVNGTSVATSSAGPTGSSSVNTATTWQEESVAAAAMVSPFTDTIHSRGRYIVINP
jgi:hypothetical protein